MQRIFEIMKDKAEKSLSDGTVDKVLAWKQGEFFYDPSPALFTKDNMEGFTYDSFCGSNLTKYLVRETKGDEKILAFLKPCDTYSINQLIKEHRIKRENITIIGIECNGKLDIEKIKAKGVKGIKNIEDDGKTLKVSTLYGEKTVDRNEVLLDKCLCCKGKKHVAADEIIGEEVETPTENRFEVVEKLEKMTPDERFEFWRGELSKCIRCNACRNVCPACTCTTCVFDNNNSGVASKANTDTFEENMYHIIRAFHVAGRCTDCGECSRVCPQNIPLHLLNRKFIKDINEFYGEYQAGADLETVPPLTCFTKEDVEPDIVKERGADK